MLCTAVVYRIDITTSISRSHYYNSWPFEGLVVVGLMSTRVASQCALLYMIRASHICAIDRSSPVVTVLTKL